MGTKAQEALENPALRLWIAQDPQSRRILEVARKVALTSATVLIRGESGTGKDLLAQIIHLLSGARNEPFVKIDCASLPPELIEGLDDYIPQLTLQRVPDATHWIVHEQPQLVIAALQSFLLQK